MISTSAVRSSSPHQSMPRDYGVGTSENENLFKMLLLMAGNARLSGISVRFDALSSCWKTFVNHLTAPKLRIRLMR